MATKFGIRNYRRTGNEVTFTVVALNPDGSIDTAYVGPVFTSVANISGGGTRSFAEGSLGQLNYASTIIDPTRSAVVDAAFSETSGGEGRASLVIQRPTGNTAGGNISTGENLFVGGAGNNSFTGNVSNDLFRFEQGGNDTGVGGGGNDGFYFGAAYTSADIVDGGEGNLDQIGLQGDYSAGILLGPVVSVEQIVLLPGNDTRFGGQTGTLLSYNLISHNAAVAAGTRLIVQGNTLRAGENLTFNGAAETNGAFTIYGGFGADNLTGGAGDDGFFFGQGRFGGGDVVNGGAGTLDQIGFQGNFTAGNAIAFGANQLTGIEGIVLLSASDTRFGSGGGTVGYTLVMDDGNVAAGQRVFVSATTLQAGERLFLIGTAETNGSFLVYSGAGNDAFEGGAQADEFWGGAGADILYGYAGADVLRGGAGNDQFRYAWLTDSTAAARDQIRDFATGDQIVLLDLAANTGGAGFTFIGSGAQTGARQVQVQQTGSAATVTIFVDGDAVADLVIDVTVAGGHALTAADFTLGGTPQEPLAKRAPDFAFDRVLEAPLDAFASPDLGIIPGSYDLTL